jgi:glucosamine--fructose-6-phosphate aminotransferase (isomerizing)
MSLHQEIHQQPEVLQKLASSQRDAVENFAAAYGKPRRILIAARGSSDNAARYAKYVLGAFNGIPVTLATPSLFSLYQCTPDLQDTLVIGISQSGESPDLLAVIEEGRHQNCPTLAVTNQPDSPLAQAAEQVLDIQAGTEKSIAATKSYTGQLLAIAMLSAAWAESAEQWRDLERVPGAVISMLGQENRLQGYAESFREMDKCIILGRGYNYATAYEWSLKLTELAYLFVQPYSSADFQHGPIAVVRDGFPVFAVAPRGAVFEGLADLLTRLKQDHRARLMIVSDDQSALDQGDAPVPLSGTLPEWLTPLEAITAGQLFTYHLTIAKGYDPDHPRGLTKVTKTY